MAATEPTTPTTTAGSFWSSYSEHQDQECEFGPGEREFAAEPIGITGKGYDLTEISYAVAWHVDEEDQQREDPFPELRSIDSDGEDVRERGMKTLALV